MPAAPTEYDCLIVGGGPAGCAAAIAAARRKLRVAIIERHAQPQPGPCAAWIGPAGQRLCRECGVDVAACGVPFRGLRLRSWDFKQCVEVADKELAGTVADAPALNAALLAAARKAGADVRLGAAVRDASLGEERAGVRLADGTAADGRVVLVADGARSETAARMRLLPARLTGSGGVCMLAEFAAGGPGHSLDVVLGAGRGLRLATIARGAGRVILALRTADEPAPPAAQMAELVGAARRAGVLPAAPEPTVSEVPNIAGVALELESHVGKHSLLVGAAGGFAASFSGEDLYPAMRSAWLAAETAADALQVPVLQDGLIGFSARWRADLAEYLQMPNTDLGLLLPMVFGNAQMSGRIARAFLLGQTF